MVAHLPHRVSETFTIATIKYPDRLLVLRDRDCCIMINHHLKLLINYSLSLNSMKRSHGIIVLYSLVARLGVVAGKKRGKIYLKAHFTLKLFINSDL